MVSFFFDQFNCHHSNSMLITLLPRFTGTALLLNGSLGLQFPQNASSMAVLVSHTWTTIPYFIPHKKTLQTCLVVGYCIYDDSVVTTQPWC